MNTNLKNKRAVVCGSTKGIGKAIAIELASLGANVTLFARDRDSLKKVLSDLDSSEKQQHDILQADFRFPDQVKDVISEYAKNTDGIHILVNNSGGPAPGLAIDADPQDFLNAFSQHLLCNQHIVQAVVPLMKVAGYGRIINVISTSPSSNRSSSSLIR